MLADRSTGHRVWAESASSARRGESGRFLWHSFSLLRPARGARSKLCSPAASSHELSCRPAFLVLLCDLLSRGRRLSRGGWCRFRWQDAASGVLAEEVVPGPVDEHQQPVAIPYQGEQEIPPEGGTGFPRVLVIVSSEPVSHPPGADSSPSAPRLPGSPMGRFAFHPQHEYTVQPSA